MKLEIIDDNSALRAFSREWSRFAEAFPPDTPFQTPEWLLAWWERFGSGKLHTVVFREASEVVGVLPAFLHSWKGRRQLTLMGAGLSDYLDPLLAPEHAGAIVDKLSDHLATFDQWDLCDWQDLSADTPLAATGGFVEDTPCSKVVLSGEFDSFLAARPKDLRRNLKRYGEKARACGEVRFCVQCRADPELLEALVRLHGERWGRAGEAGVITANGAAGFLHDAAEALGSKDMLRFFAIYFRGRIVAILMALRTPGTLFSYLSAFDPDWAAFGFGRELLAQAFAYAFSEGYRCWNFLRGDEAYKFSWGAVPVPKRRIVLPRSGSYAGAPNEERRTARP